MLLSHRMMDTIWITIPGYYQGWLRKSNKHLAPYPMTFEYSSARLWKLPSQPSKQMYIRLLSEIRTHYRLLPWLFEYWSDYRVQPSDQRGRQTP
jgi:hypothetical protein